MMYKYIVDMLNNNSLFFKDGKIVIFLYTT